MIQKLFRLLKIFSVTLRYGLDEIAFSSMGVARRGGLDIMLLLKVAAAVDEPAAAGPGGMPGAENMAPAAPGFLA